MSETILRLPLAVALLALPCVADVITVEQDGTGDFSTVTAAVAAALDGDVILIGPGDYLEPGPIVLDDRTLTFVGAQNGGKFGYTAWVRAPFIVEGDDPGAEVTFQNLWLFGLGASDTLSATSSILVLEAAGQVHVRDCNVTGGASNLLFRDAAAAIRVFQGGPVHLHDATVRGGFGSYGDAGPSGTAGRGLVLAGGTVHAWRTSLRGGEGASFDIGGFPISADGGTGALVLDGELLLSSSTCTGGNGGTSNNGGDGGDGIVVQGGQVTVLTSSFFDGGDGGWSDEGPDGRSGVAVVDPLGGIVDLGAPTRGLGVDSVLREGQPGTLSITAQPSDLRLLFFGQSLAMLPLPEFAGVFAVDPLTAIPLAIQGAGSANVPFTAPTLPPGVEHLRFLLQPVFLNAGQIFLGGPTSMIVLDAAF